MKRIILARPAVEAGEKLGFLPGDLAEKVNPYLRPLYDALHDMMDADRAAQLVEQGTIEVAPLAFMRGRTLNDAFVILDEAQNTTVEQMKMFLTRLGYDSKAVITGDVTQVDLPVGKMSGPERTRAGCSGTSRGSRSPSSPTSTSSATRSCRRSFAPTTAIRPSARRPGPSRRRPRRIRRPPRSPRRSASRPSRRPSRRRRSRHGAASWDSVAALSSRRAPHVRRRSASLGRWATPSDRPSGHPFDRMDRSSLRRFASLQAPESMRSN